MSKTMVSDNINYNVTGLPKNIVLWLKFNIDDGTNLEFKRILRTIFIVFVGKMMGIVNIFFVNNQSI